MISVALLFANVNAEAARPSVPPATSIAKMIGDLSNSAKTDSEWHDNAILVDDLKRSFFSADYTDNDRCDALESASDIDLVNFYDDINSYDQLFLSSCLSSLQMRMMNYLNSQTTKLAANYKAIASEILTPCSDRKTEVFGPAQDWFVKPEGQVLYGDDLPPCAINLTFDDGPHPTLTNQLLKLLEEEKTTVNFFVVGRMVKANPGVLLNSYEHGHLIGNHTLEHKDLRKLSFEDATQQIESGYDSIKAVLNYYLPFFRFPYGASTPKLRSYLGFLSRVEFYWNIDTRDWAIKDPEALFKNALMRIQEQQKGIALFHDIQPQTIAAMPFIIKSLKEAGYTPYVVRPVTSNEKK